MFSGVLQCTPLATGLTEAVDKRDLVPLSYKMIVLVYLTVTVSTSQTSGCSADQFIDRRGKGLETYSPCYSSVGISLHGGQANGVIIIQHS